MESSISEQACKSIQLKKEVIMKTSPMNDEFHDWLDSCPVMWFRGEVTKDHVTYIFETPPEEDKDDSN